MDPLFKNNRNFQLLARLLNTHDAWRVLALRTNLFSENSLITMSTNPDPANDLLLQLKRRKFSFQRFQRLLTECFLFDALALTIFSPERIKIVRQPTEGLNNENQVVIALESPFKLIFGVTGMPQPSLQWYKDSEPLPDHTSFTLNYDNFRPNMEGKYYCVATQINTNGQGDELASEIVTVSAQPVSCRILDQPEEYTYILEGSPLMLCVEAIGYPEPNYEWFYENQLILKDKPNLFIAQSAKVNQSGMYRCRIFNKCGEFFVITTVIVYTIYNYSVYEKPIGKKIALLIGNQNYQNAGKLQTPQNDIECLAKILRDDLNFLVVCKTDLTLLETQMEIDLFSEQVDENCLVFFYYAGHGFNMGDCYLVPVDSPNWETIKRENCIKESFILNRILSKCPILLIALFDMCLKMPKNDENQLIHEENDTPLTYNPKRNLIKGYSTTTNLSSYEKCGSLNSIYVTSLKKFLGQDEPIITILSKVTAEIKVKCPSQSPTIWSITAEHFYLNK